jgi:hypothetical protein
MVVTDTAKNTFSANSSNSATLDQDTGESPTLSFVDTLVGAAGAKMVHFSVGGIDASDDTAVITFTDHNGKTTTATVMANGAATADLSMLADGGISAAMVVTDTAKNTFSANSSNSATLDQDTGEQAGLKLSFGDTLIGSAGAKTVHFSIAGIDSDDTAVVTFTDHNNKTTTATETASGTFTADLSMLADGGISAAMVVTDTAKNTFNASSSNSATLDHMPPVPIMLDAVPGNNTTILSGTAEANSSVSVYEDGNLIGTVGADSHGNWSLQANPITGSTVHSFTEKETDLAGNTVPSAGVSLYTPSSNLLLKGGTGNDVLIGRPNDTLTGGGGSDTFVFNQSFGKETITDFDVTHDVIRLDHKLFANPSPTGQQVLGLAQVSGNNTVITIDAADTITLLGVGVQQHLQAGDFQFF